MIWRQLAVVDHGSGSTVITMKMVRLPSIYCNLVCEAMWLYVKQPLFNYAVEEVINVREVGPFISQRGHIISVLASISAFCLE